MHLTPQLSGGTILRSALWRIVCLPGYQAAIEFAESQLEARQLIERINRFQYLCPSLDGHASSSAVELMVRRRRRPASRRSVGGLHCY